MSKLKELKALRKRNEALNKVIKGLETKIEGGEYMKQHIEKLSIEEINEVKKGEIILAKPWGFIYVPAGSEEAVKFVDGDWK